jgi:methylmalonyl-CoA/ethylmalonyl-CoA epimerase
VHVRTLRAGDVLIELLAPVSDQGAVARFLSKRGPGLHHLAFRVADLDAEIVRLQGEGVPLIDATPRPGIHGTRVVFIHPRFADGVLVELVEHPNT